MGHEHHPKKSIWTFGTQMSWCRQRKTSIPRTPFPCRQDNHHCQLQTFWYATFFTSSILLHQECNSFPVENPALSMHEPWILNFQNLYSFQSLYPWQLISPAVTGTRASGCRYVRTSTKRGWRWWLCESRARNPKREGICERSFQGHIQIHFTLWILWMWNTTHWFFHM